MLLCKNMNLNYKLVVPVAVAALVLALVGGFLLFQGGKTSKDPQQASQDEVKRLVAEVGKIIDLPTGETPTLATVVDVSKLKDQPFFQKAKNGDKVLIYSGAQKAILYDPVAKKVKEVGPVNVASPSAQQQVVSTNIKVVLLNGTKSAGLASKAEEELKKQIASLEIISKDNAKKDTYEKTVVVVLNQAFLDQARKVAETLKATMTGLPEGEDKPTRGDILVILGKDRI